MKVKQLYNKVKKLDGDLKFKYSDSKSSISSVLIYNSVFAKLVINLYQSSTSDLLLDVEEYNHMKVKDLLRDYDSLSDLNKEQEIIVADCNGNIVDIPNKILITDDAVIIY